MSLDRRELLKGGAILGVSTFVSGCGNLAPQPSKDMAISKVLLKKSKKKRVVVVGGGFGGLTASKYIRMYNDEVEVVLLEKKAFFMSCPYSNLYLGGVKGVDMDVLTHDYFKPAEKYGYRFIQTEVLDIDRKRKTVTTTKGKVLYDILVLSPGIAYDYKKQFKNWDDEKISQVNQSCPPAMITGSEHLALKRQLRDLKSGNVVLTVPDGKYRCPPAPYERACMMANYIKENKLKAKVIILDTLPQPKTKAKAFNEAFSEVFSDIIELRGNSVVED
ncbi:MAG: NAD(P)/FAD-dependent oxidoreductase, partial [Campylobacterales bacterium]|nr:NAD(P)/FAD-dependent oxidoreductase [Campylobacterales bacterium]